MQFLKKRNSHQYILVLLVVLLVFFGIKFSSEKKRDQTEISQPGYAALEGHSQEIFPLTKADQNTEGKDMVEINLTGQQESVTITSGGSYRLSGECEHTLYIDAEEEIVHLLLDSVKIHSKEGSALQVISAGKVVVTLKEGTENVLTDAPVYPSGTEAKGALYSSCDLTINGSGKLSVYGYYENGIYSRDLLKLLDGDMFIQAKKDALRGSDGVLIQVSKLEIECEGNGIVTVNAGKRQKGTIDIGAGNISIIAGEYGIVSSADLNIHDCSLYNKSVISEYQVAGKSKIDERCFHYE